MFLPIQFRDKEGPYTEHLNVTHITRVSFVNQMNPDAGTKIHLRTGEVLTTPITMDIISEKMDDCWKSAATLVIFNVLAEKAKIMSKDDEDVDEDLQFQENE
tara:strand:+ start:360 stop:665 length:306 start_codon:yes stop_codon:yes gene_type:complete